VKKNIQPKVSPRLGKHNRKFCFFVLVKKPQLLRFQLDEPMSPAWLHCFSNLLNHFSNLLNHFSNPVNSVSSTKNYRNVRSSVNMAPRTKLQKNKTCLFFNFKEKLFFTFLSLVPFLPSYGRCGNFRCWRHCSQGWRNG